jgi:hypothetical protein
MWLRRITPKLLAAFSEKWLVICEKLAVQSRVEKRSWKIVFKVEAIYQTADHFQVIPDSFI